MPGPLWGIRVIDLTSMISGPLAAMMLGDQGADVIKVENPGGGDPYRPGVADRIGVGEAAVRAVAPGIVYVAVSGFGETGPYASKPVYDPLVQAVSGLATVQAGLDEERPRLVRTILPDKLTGIVAAQAITAALLARARTGEG